MQIRLCKARPERRHRRTARSEDGMPPDPVMESRSAASVKGDERAFRARLHHPRALIGNTGGGVRLLACSLCPAPFWAPEVKLLSGCHYRVVRTGSGENTLQPDIAFMADVFVNGS